MSSDFAPTNLTHHFLIAMPGLEDEAFKRSVIYLCEHSERGALGLVINKPSDIVLEDLFSKVELPLGRPDLMGVPVFHGGPVHTDRGFVLHDPLVVEGMADDESVFASTLAVPGGLEMTTSRDVLEAMAAGAGPKRVFVSLGYASWAFGQLESEITESSWLAVQADTRLIFDTPIEQRYTQALALLGVNEVDLSRFGGQA